MSNELPPPPEIRPAFEMGPDIVDAVLMTEVYRDWKPSRSYLPNRVETVVSFWVLLFENAVTSEVDCLRLGQLLAELSQFVDPGAACVSDIVAAGCSTDAKGLFQR